MNEAFAELRLTPRKQPIFAKAMSNKSLLKCKTCILWYVFKQSKSSCVHHEGGLSANSLE